MPTVDSVFSATAVSTSCYHREGCTDLKFGKKESTGVGLVLRISITGEEIGLMRCSLCVDAHPDRDKVKETG